jgi:cytochrome-b5 reductase
MQYWDTGEPTQLAIFATATVCFVGFILLSKLRWGYGNIPARPSLVDSDKIVHFALKERCHIGKNVIRLRFALNSDEEVLGLPVGRHLTLSAQVGNPLNETDVRSISRQYTPITSDFSDKGYFDLVIKVYRKNEHTKYPEGGWMSQYLESIPIGAKVSFRGPCGRIEYRENGRFKLGHSERKFREVVMIAGGTGITPMYQLMNHILKTRKGLDKLKLTLIFGNQTPEDILLHEELLKLRDEHSEQLKIVFTVDRIDEGQVWDGRQGYVSKDMLLETIPSPSEHLLILLCGPPLMVKSLQSILNDSGYSKSNVYAF